MQNAYECEEEFGKGGRVVKRVRRIGGVVPCSVVFLAGIIFGREMPAGLWGVFQTLGK